MMLQQPSSGAWAFFSGRQTDRLAGLEGSPRMEHAEPIDSSHNRSFLP